MYMCVYIYVCMYDNDKRGHELEREHGGVGKKVQLVCSSLGSLFLNPQQTSAACGACSPVGFPCHTLSQSGQLSPAQLGLDVATGPAAKRGKWPILV